MLTKQQTATVIDALRLYQRTVKGRARLNGYVPMTDAQIDALCEDLNIGPADLFLLHIVGDVEPYLIGRFKSATGRNAAARRLRAKAGDEDGIYQLDVHRNGVPSVYPFAGAFFMPGGLHNLRPRKQRRPRRKGKGA